MTYRLCDAEGGGPNFFDLGVLHGDEVKECTEA